MALCVDMFFFDLENSAAMNILVHVILQTVNAHFL